MLTYVESHVSPMKPFTPGKDKSSPGALAFIAAVWISVSQVMAGSTEVRASGLDLARKQFQQVTLEQSRTESEQAARFAADLRPDGSWADIDYASRERAGWPPRLHLVRVLAMSKAASPLAPGSARQEALSRVHLALSYWREHNFQCPNWWHNRIGVPQKLGAIALLLNDQLRREEFVYITETVMPRCATGNSTGQNRVWLAGCELMDGLLRRDEKKVAESARTIFAQATVAAGNEGVQADWSFHQHGPQQQFGTYGLAFAADQIEWLSILQGTPWAMSEGKREVLRRYLLDGLNWVFWRGALDTSCCGRQLEPDSPVLKGKSASQLMRTMSRLDPGHAVEYDAFVKRNEMGDANDLTGCRYFWRSDYLVQRRKDFCFTLKMCSARVTGSESLNSQNLSGYYLGDGVTYFYCAGDEYRNLFPVWNWRKLPGVTCAQDAGPLPAFGSYKLDSRFVGAVSDGSNACAVLNYRRDGVSALKAWFLHDDQIVCLGSAVRTTPEVKAPLATTVNQCRLRGQVRISDGKSEITLEPGTHAYSNLAWVEHDGLRYTFPSREEVRICNQSRVGNWKTVARTSSMPAEDVSEAVFTLSIEHGVEPKDGTYAYCISPATGAREPVQVVANTETLQAVRFRGGLVEAVFHAPGSLTDISGHLVAVDSPCVALLEVTGGVLSATVADPTQSRERIRLQLDDKGCDAQLPTGLDAGRSTPRLHLRGAANH
jgi:chondroitin AC lyase